MKDWYVTDGTKENNFCYWLCMTDRGKIIVEYDIKQATEHHIRHIARTCGRSGNLAIIVKPWTPKVRKITVQGVEYTIVYPSWYELKKRYPRYARLVKTCRCKAQFKIKKGSF